MNEDQISVDLPLSAKMHVDVAYKNVVIAVRAFNANAETHESLAQSLGVIREQLEAFGALLAKLQPAAKADDAIVEEGKPVLRGADGKPGKAGERGEDGESVVLQ